MKHSTKKIAINKLKELNYIIVNESEYLQDKKATTNYKKNIKLLILMEIMLHFSVNLNIIHGQLKNQILNLLIVKNVVVKLHYKWC